MTPKEKAEEIYYKFGISSTLVVDEILNALPILIRTTYSEKYAENSFFESQLNGLKCYWNEVKEDIKEIEKK